MTTLRQAAAQALEWIAAKPEDRTISAGRMAGILTLALESEQRYEPVAIVERHGIVADVEWLPASWALRNGDKLYTRQQPAQQPLTEFQIHECWHPSKYQFTRNIEAAHGITGETK